ncbi:MAG TPA: JAB domain-containing protein [Candidatus Thermoplasmatota archaeon]|nr:JAB domain-containing protein [Candidatus Thermoplasmatota archaeon]
MNHILQIQEPIGKIQTPTDLFKRVQKVNIDHSKEHFIAITLTTKNLVINTHIISIGILDASLIHPREVFRKAISDNAYSLILAHNHPSGSVQPSEADKAVTALLKQAGEIIGISVIDHIIFTETDFISMKEQGSF